MRNATNQISTRVKHTRSIALKRDFQTIIKQLRNREQIIFEMFNKSNVLENEMLINFDYSLCLHFTFLVIPECHLFFALHGGEVGEPFSISGHVLRAAGVHQPHVLQSSIIHLHRTIEGRWLSAGVSKTHLRNPALNQTTKGSPHSPMNIII